MTIDVRLVNKGMHEPRAGLVDEAALKVALGREYASELAEHGWSAADTDELEAGRRELDTTMAQQADLQGTTRQAGVDTHAAVDQSKDFIFRLRQALPRVLRETTGVSEKDFAVGGPPLRRSAPRLHLYLNHIAPAVARIEIELRPYFGGQSATRMLTEAQEALDRANTAHEIKLGDLPLATQQVYQAKGRVLELIEDLNRAGRSAFRGNAAIAARFNKDLLLRARRHQAQAQQSPPPATAEG